MRRQINPAAAATGPLRCDAAMSVGPNARAEGSSLTTGLPALGTADDDGTRPVVPAAVTRLDRGRGAGEDDVVVTGAVARAPSARAAFKMPYPDPSSRPLAPM
ncbi:MAG: hypothetical protein ACXVQX_11545, partial [Actinomycetota bacterium]